MKRFLMLLTVVSVISLSLVSCGGGNQQTAEQKDTTAAVQAAGPYADLPSDIQAMMPKGEEIYKTKCLACHQAEGQGVPKTFPPIAKSDYLLADKVRAVAQVLNGSKESMTVNGEVYTQEMLPQVDTKEDAVAIINYVLNNFGNKGGYVTLDDVKDVVVKPRPEAKK